MSDESVKEIEEAVDAVEPPLWEEEARNPSQRRSWLMPLFLGTGVGLAIAFGGMRVVVNRGEAQSSKAVANQAPSQAPSMTVTLATALNTPISRSLTATGSVAARELTPVLPQSNGLLIKEVLVNEGDAVKPGQVLAVLDDSVVQSQILQAKADVESRQADVAGRQADLASRQAAVESAKATVLSTQAIVQQRQADLGQARARLIEAQKNFQRVNGLANQGAVSRQQLDSATTTLATATEAVRLAEANVNSAIANVSSARATIARDAANVKSAVAQVNSARANVRSTAARVEQLRTQLGYTAVRAPVGGLVAEKLARVGDVTGVPPQTQVGTVVGGSQKLFSIIREGSLELQAQVPQTQLPQIKVGATVQVTSDTDSRLRLQGRVREIEPVVNDRRREATVKIDLPRTGNLKPGMFARALITINNTMGIAVPKKAVVPQADGTSIVFVLENQDKVRAQKVEVGEILNGGKVEIRSGLIPGTKVVLNGAGYVTNGDKVKVVQSQ